MQNELPPMDRYAGRRAPVLFIQYALCEGGAGYYVSRLADALADRYVVDVTAHVAPGGAATRDLRSAAVVPMGLGLIAHAAVVGYRYIDAAMPLRPAHVRLLEALRVCCPFAKIGIRFHGELPFIRGFNREMLLGAARMADVLVFHHEQTLGEICGWLGDDQVAGRAAIAPPGIDIERFRPGGTDPRAVVAYAGRFGLGPWPVVAMAGRPGPEKNWLDYILIANELRRRFDGRVTCLAITGVQRGQPMGAYFRRMVQFNKDLGAPVRFTGFLPDWQNLLAGVDVLVHTSCSESFCRVAAEAQAAGVPVVALGVGGLKHVVVEHDVTGYLIEPQRGHRWNARLTRRDRERFCTSVAALIGGHSRRQRMGEAAHQRASLLLDDTANSHWHAGMLSALLGDDQ